jgi:hypothetical protein
MEWSQGVMQGRDQLAVQDSVHTLAKGGIAPRIDGGCLDIQVDQILFLGQLLE